MWPHLLSAAIGAWVEASPGVLGFPRPAATNAWIVGPIVVAVGLVSAWGATRPVRWVNLPAGLWLVAAPLLIDHSAAATGSGVACGVVIAALALVPGRVRHRYDGGWPALWRPVTPVRGR